MPDQKNMPFTGAQKAELIRRGNQLFNEGKYFEAGRIFRAVGYKDGLIRLGDYFFFDKNLPLVAYGFYRDAQYTPMLERIKNSFVFALKCLLSEGGPTPARPAAEKTEESLKVRQANPPDSGSVRETREQKIERTLAMLRRLQANSGR
ncbi:MAG: hypothetical protein NZL89_05025 [Leptospiraceae bacterium]|nr:hypothetical protein [Leptospiraceae bacterium]